MRAITINDVYACMRLPRSVAVRSAYCLLLAAACMLPAVAHASVTGAGGGMPYSSGLGIFNASIRGEVGGILIVIATVAGVGGYIMQGQLTGLMETIGRVMIGIGVVGGVAALATLAGVTGAVI